jgi:hypothetical protein
MGSRRDFFYAVLFAFCNCDKKGAVIFSRFYFFSSQHHLWWRPRDHAGHGFHAAQRRLAGLCSQ